MDIGKSQKGWVSGNYPFFMAKDNIKSVKQESWHGSGEMDKAMLVRVELNEPYMHFICADEKDWDELESFFNTSKKVVSLKDFKPNHNQA